MYILLENIIMNNTDCVCYNEELDGDSIPTCIIYQIFFNIMFGLGMNVMYFISTRNN
jgi:hypothetical protein